jgi:hypothetical protein
MFTETSGMTHLCKRKIQKAFYLKDWKFNILSRLDCKSIMGNYSMPYKDVEKQKYLIWSFYFARGVLKLSITNVWDIMRQCHVSVIGRHTGKQILLYCWIKWCNISLWETWKWRCYMFRALGLTAVSLPCETREGFESALCSWTTEKIYHRSLI